MSYRLTWEGCIPRFRREVTLAEAAQPRKPVTLTVQDASIHIWARVSDDETTYDKALATHPRRDRFGCVEFYPAAMAVENFFSNWKSKGFAAMNSGYIARWEDFICATVTYTDREVTLP